MIKMDAGERQEIMNSLIGSEALFLITSFQRMILT